MLGKSTIVTNGDQTDTIYDFMAKGMSFEDALRTRTFEPDGPNFTPRISGTVCGAGYQLSILKSADGNPDAVHRFSLTTPTHCPARAMSSTPTGKTEIPFPLSRASRCA